MKILPIKNPNNNKSSMNFEAIKIKNELSYKKISSLVPLYHLTEIFGGALRIGDNKYDLRNLVEKEKINFLKYSYNDIFFLEEDVLAIINNPRNDLINIVSQIIYIAEKAKNPSARKIQSKLTAIEQAEKNIQSPIKNTKDNAKKKLLLARENFAITLGLK